MTEQADTTRYHVLAAEDPGDEDGEWRAIIRPTREAAEKLARDMVAAENCSPRGRGGAGLSDEQAEAEEKRLAEEYGWQGVAFSLCPPNDCSAWYAIFIEPCTKPCNGNHDWLADEWRDYYGGTPWWTTPSTIPN
jgi:hypothetical protein